MGRTFEVLGGRHRRSANAEPVAAIPFPTADLEPPPNVELVPMSADDLPSDNDGLPYIEVGGPRAKVVPPVVEKIEAPSPPIRPPALMVSAIGTDLSFQLLTPETMPKSGPLSPDLVAYHTPENPVARQYRRLVDGIAAQHPTGRSPVLVFTSAMRSAGSTVANLAVTRAGDGLGRVLVVEADRAPGSAGSMFGVPAAPGLRELLARSIPLGLAVHRTSVDGLFVLPAGRAELGAAESARLTAVLDQLRARFEWVLVEAAMPALGEWAKAGDAMYLVLRQDDWDSPQADAAHEAIARSGGRLRGCITTRDLNAAG